MSCPIGQESAPVAALMDRVLRDGAPIAPEYPLVFDERFDGRLIASRDGEVVQSACGILARTFVLGETRVKGGLIGSVATDEACRGSGLATRVLVQAEAALQLEGCAFAVLWAQDPEFYLKRGYGPVGCEVDFVLPSRVAARLPRVDGVRTMTDADAPAVHALYEAHTTRFERTPDETAALLGCPEMTRLVVERDGAVVAYACMGRGQDLGDAIHEWGGATNDVLALVRALLELRFPASSGPAEPAPALPAPGQITLALPTADPALPQPDESAEALFLMAPGTATDLVAALEALGLEPHRRMLGLGKILDRAAAVDALNERLGDARIELFDGPQPYVVRGGDREALLDDEAILALLIGVPDVHGDVRAFLEAFGASGARLPLEPFVWGLDSI